MQESTFRFQVYLTPRELISQSLLRIQIFLAHKSKRERYKNIQLPADFLQRGSRLYKKHKLKLAYCLSLGFSEGGTYNEVQVERAIHREGKFLPNFGMDTSHAWVALIELGLLERTRDCRFYWRKPNPDRIEGLVFPCLVEGFEKAGYDFYEPTDLGFSVAYSNQASDSRITFYAFGSRDDVINENSVGSKFAQAKEEIFDIAELNGQKVEILEEKKLNLEREERGSETVCHLSLKCEDSDGKAVQSHLVMTSWRNRFMKVRMSAPESVPNALDTLYKLITSILVKLTKC